MNNREKQAAWRERQRKAGFVQITLTVPADAAPDFKTAADIAKRCNGKSVRLSVCDESGRFVSPRKPTSAAIAERRIRNDAPMFSEVVLVSN